MTGINVACMVRNEMGRFWRQALAAWATFTHDVIVLDDGSTDETADLAREADALVIQRPAGAPTAWGDEARAREQLFAEAWRVTRVDDYILILDADMVPARDPRILTETGADGVFFRLYDIWKIRERAEGGPPRLWYRDDRFWRAHHHPRVWMVRKTREFEPHTHDWPARGMHSGHLPASMRFERFAWAPEDFSLLHFAYATESLRDEKYVSYAKVSADLTDFERAHARTIRDEAPPLVELPFTPDLWFTLS